MTPVKGVTTIYVLPLRGFPRRDRDTVYSSDALYGCHARPSTINEGKGA